MRKRERKTGKEETLSRAFSSRLRALRPDCLTPSLSHSLTSSLHHSHGSVLVYVVWIVVLLSLFAVGVGSRTMAALSLSERLMEQLRATAVAHGAVEYARAVIAEDATPGADGLQEWLDRSDQFRDHALLGGTVSIRPGAAISGEVYGFSDEEQRINLNTAPAVIPEPLFRILGGLGQQDASEVVAAIEDWRDADDDERPFGAENYYYGSLTHAYACKNGPFENLEELLLVRGVTPALYAQVEPYVTVYGAGQINLNTAPPGVLQVLGLSAEGIAGLESFRTGDQRLTSVLGIESDLKAHLPVKDLAHLLALAQKHLLAVRSTAFRMTITARTEWSPHPMHLSCILDRAGAVKLWSER